MEIPNIDPLPLEKEFQALRVTRRLSELSREQLEEFLTESLFLLTRLAHQTQQLKDYIEKFTSEQEG